MNREEQEEVLWFVRNVKNGLKCVFVVVLPTVITLLLYYSVQPEHHYFGSGLYLGFFWWVMTGRAFFRA